MRRTTPYALFLALMLAGAGTLQAQEAAKPPLPSHDMEGKENCVMCHKVGGDMGAMPASHEGFKSENCLLCHAESSPLQTGQAPPAIPHDMAGKENCAMCHASGVMGATKTPENHGDIKSESCGYCHKPAS
jgi:hypothetical protein